MTKEDKDAERAPLVKNATNRKLDREDSLYKYLEPLTGADQDKGLPDHLSYDPVEYLAPTWQKAKSKLLIGLSDEEVAKRHDEFGLNALPKEEKDLFKALLKELFCEPMPIVVWAAIGIEAVEAVTTWPGSDARSSLIDVFVLLLLQFLNVVVGFFEELNAIEAMKEHQDKQAEREVTVIRNGVRQNQLSTTLLVPGDIVCLNKGQMIPADLKMLMGQKSCRVDNSSMTGEGMAVTVHPGALLSAVVAPITRLCSGQLLWMGAVIDQGDVEGIVINTALRVRSPPCPLQRVTGCALSHWAPMCASVLLHSLWVSLVTLADWSTLCADQNRIDDENDARRNRKQLCEDATQFVSMFGDYRWYNHDGCFSVHHDRRPGGIVWDSIRLLCGAADRLDSNCLESCLHDHAGAWGRRAGQGWGNCEENGCD